MNLTGEKANTEQSSNAVSSVSSTYTSEIIGKLETLRDSLEYSTTSISTGLNKLVGNDTLVSTDSSAKEKRSYEGEYGNIHALIDDLFQLAEINHENRFKLNRIV